MFFIRFVVHFGDRLPLPSAIMHIRFSDLKTADWRTARRTATICQFSCCDLMMIVSSHHRRRKKRQNKTGNTKRSRVELHRRWTTHIRRINERSRRLITNCILYKSWLSRIIHILKASAVDAFWTQFYMFIVCDRQCFVVELTSHIIYESSSESIRVDAAAAGLRALLPSRWIWWLHASAASQTFLLHHQAFCSARFCAIRPVVSLRILYAVNNKYNTDKSIRLRIFPP